MPATVTIKRLTGNVGAPTLTDITSGTTRVSLSDSATPGTATPCLIPNSSTNYSFWAVIAMYADTSPAGTIDTVKLYSDGVNSFGTGVTMVIGQATTYVQATGSATTGILLNTTNYVTLTGAPVDVFTYTAGSPLAITGSISNPSTGKVTNYVPFQMAVASTAAPGIVSAETLTMTYNET